MVEEVSVHHFVDDDHAPATVRAFEAGPDGLEFIAVGTDRPEGGDGMQTENFWDD